MFPAQPECIGKREPGHLDELLIDAQADCAIKAYMSDRVSVAYSCTCAAQCRLFSSRLFSTSFSSKLFSTRLGTSATVWRHLHASGVEQPGHTFVGWMQDRRSVEVLQWNQRKQLRIVLGIEKLVDAVSVAKAKMIPRRE